MADLLHSAAQIAAALQKADTAMFPRLGRTKRAVLMSLQGIAPDGFMAVKGQQAAAWKISSLIKSAYPKLEYIATASGFRSAATMFAAPAKAPWQPQIVTRAGPLEIVSLADLHPDCIAAAVRLQRALASSLERMNDLTLTGAQFEQRGLADYLREFGHTITARYWRELFRRTVDRDAGAECWSRLEIYLPGVLKRQTPAIAPALSVAGENQFRELHEMISAFKQPAQPSAAEAQLLWLHSFELFAAITTAEQQPKKTKRALLTFLWRHAPALAKSANALRANWERKRAAWLAADGDVNALADKRQAAAAARRLEISTEDRDKIVGHAVLKCGGRVSQAWRDLRESGELSEALQQRYQANPSRKSHVPQNIRAAVGAEVELLEDMHHGPRQAKLNGAHISRDWSEVYAGDWMQSDDNTPPLYYYVPDGRGWFTMMRGQFLPMLDLRSTCILDFVLISERNYNALTIRSLITKVCDKYGLPRRGFYFENGVWRQSKILKGDSDAVPSCGEVELGLRSIGLEFRHAKLPRAKPVEGVLGQLQNLMEGEAGYVGRNEMIEKFERVQRQKLDVESQKVHPSKYFYSEDEWVARLAEICEQYNRIPQDGKMTGGLSPEDAYAKYQNLNDPPVKFDSICRYLLATHKRPVRIGANGITLRFGKRAFTYRNETTGRLIGQSALAWFDPACPQVLTVTDMNRENPFSVPQAVDVPAMDATPEQMSAAMAGIAAHQSYARTRYSNLRAKFIPRSRVTLVDADTAKLGAQMLGQRMQIAADESNARQHATKARKVSSRLKMTLTPAQQRRPGSVEALDDLSRLLQDDSEPVKAADKL